MSDSSQDRFVVTDVGRQLLGALEDDLPFDLSPSCNARLTLTTPEHLEALRRDLEQLSSQCWTSGNGTGVRPTMTSLAALLERAAVTVNCCNLQLRRLEAGDAPEPFRRKRHAPELPR